MTRAVAGGDFGGERRLVQRLAPKLLEGQRDSQSVACAEFGHRSKQCARIQSRREENGDRHVGHQVMTHRVVHRSTQLIAGTRRIAGRAA